MAQPSESEMGARYMTFQELLKDEREKNAADKKMNRPPKVRPKNLTIGRSVFYGKIQF